MAVSLQPENAPGRAFDPGIDGGALRSNQPGRRLVYAMGAVDGWSVLSLDALHAALQVSIDFTDLGGRTRMELRLDLPDGYIDRHFGATLDDMRNGMAQTVDRLVLQLNGRRAAPAA